MKRPTLILLIIFFNSACSNLNSRQARAPIYDPYAKKALVKPSTERIGKSASSVVTHPLEPSAPPSWAVSQDPTPHSSHLSPVVVALINDAEQNSSTGNLESAAATLERGLRIEPRNATLVFKLAEVRLKQSKPRLAEDLAKKSALLAGSDRQLKRKSWRLVAQAQRLQGKKAEATKSELKAASQ